MASNSARRSRRGFMPVFDGRGRRLQSRAHGASCAVLFFDWLARLWRVALIRVAQSLSHFGGVLDSTLGWSAPLPVESRGSLVKSPAKKLIGNNEEMPLAA